jgi:hypothetical protein
MPGVVKLYPRGAAGRAAESDDAPDDGSRPERLIGFLLFSVSGFLVGLATGWLLWG